MYSYNTPRPRVMLSNIVLGFDGVGLNVLLVQRIEMPFKDEWSIPQGEATPGESLSLESSRILSGVSNITGLYSYQFSADSHIEDGDSDWTLTIGFFSLACRSVMRSTASTDHYRLAWFPIEELPDTISDSDRTRIDEAHKALRDLSHLSPVMFYLLDPLFSVSEMQRATEVINDTFYDRRNFYRKVIASGLLELESTAKVRAPHRPPQMFRFRRDLYEERLKADPAMDYPFLF